MRYKTLQAYNTKVLSAEEGIIEAIVSVFNNIDKGNPPERVIPGAFAESLQRKYPKGIWMHNWEKPVALTLEAKELFPDDPSLPLEIRALGGLYIKGQFNLDTSRGRDAFSDISKGIIDEFSIGFEVDEFSVNKKDKCYDLIKIRLYEWSPVLAGCNPETQLISVKAMDIQDDLKPQNIEEKNAVLGNIESGMTLAALDSLYCRWWWNICDICWDYGNENLSLDEKLKDLQTKGDELIRVTISTIRALMGDPTSTEKGIADIETKEYISQLREKGLQFTMQEKAGAKHSADTTKRVTAAIDLMKKCCVDMKDCHKDLEDMLTTGIIEEKSITTNNAAIVDETQLRLKRRLLEIKSKSI